MFGLPRQSGPPGFPLRPCMPLRPVTSYIRQRKAGGLRSTGNEVLYSDKSEHRHKGSDPFFAKPESGKQSMVDEQYKRKLKTPRRGIGSIALPLDTNHWLKPGHLPRQRAVDGRAHGTQVFLPHIGMNWGGSVAECHNPLIKRSLSIQIRISMFLIL